MSAVKRQLFAISSRLKLYDNTTYSICVQTRENLIFLKTPPTYPQEKFYDLRFNDWLIIF